MPGWIEKVAEKLHLIPRLEEGHREATGNEGGSGRLLNHPPPERWDDWEEYDPACWPQRRKQRYMIVPTNCFNCESGCGLLSYIDKDTLKVRKFEGNPLHPGSRGHCCAKGPATINQIQDADRILYPLKRSGPRGSGQWQRISWEEALEAIAGEVAKALREDRRNEVVYHVGRPGHEGFMDRVLKAWGVDGHNSHTNICSAGARLGYSMWHGDDRPSPDFAQAEFILLLSAHLESGHYFNPHAQRIMEAKSEGAKLAVLDPRLSNTASMADYWLPTYPGSEAAVLLAMAKILLDEELYNEAFLRDWVNWKAFMNNCHPQQPATFEAFLTILKETYREFTPDFAARESGVDPEVVSRVAYDIGAAGSRFACHIWRGAGSGNLGGWGVARCLHFLSVLTGSVGTPGGTLPSGWNKFKPRPFSEPPGQKFWNELHFPREYPLSHYEMSFLLPQFLQQERGKISVYFTRVFNPVFTYPDGFSWMKVLQDKTKIGLHIALTPTWNETAYFADYVLPMGHASERHDLISYETHSGVWIGFRQPVLREAARRLGKPVERTWEVNPGQVWEEDEFWIDLSWKVDRDGQLGIRQHFTSRRNPGRKISVDEYYAHIFEHVPGLPERAAFEGLSPLDYMRRFGAFEVEKTAYNKHLREVPAEQMDGSSVDPESQTVSRRGTAIGVIVNGVARTGFNTPSRKQEFYSETLAQWGWPEFAIPTYVRSHVHPDQIDQSRGEMVLLPTFRLPTLIHSRSGNAKWLAEIANRNPLWIHSSDARRLGLKTGDLVRVETEIGYFVDSAWVTESIRPGVVACSHHLGRWRRPTDPVANRWAVSEVEIQHSADAWKMSRTGKTRAGDISDPDVDRIFWSEGGVPQNLTFPVHPDPVSGMHCWHQKVRVRPARPGDRFGDVRVDLDKSNKVFQEWLALTRPAPGPGGLRRPLWLKRPLRPAEDIFYLP